VSVNDKMMATYIGGCISTMGVIMMLDSLIIIGPIFFIIGVSLAFLQLEKRS